MLFRSHGVAFLREVGKRGGESRGAWRASDQTSDAVSVSGAVEQQAAATREVSMNINGVNQAAGHTGSASANLLNLADAVTRQVAGLGTKVDSFLRSINAA